jgi:HK97 gp10 family phage protein
MKLKLSGGEEALRNLEYVTQSTGEHHLRADALEAIQPIVEDARKLAPVGQGDLRDSIEGTIFDDGTVGVIIGDWKGHFFEFGTVNMRATPMLIPAVEANSEQVLDAFGERIAVRISGSFNPRAGLRVDL